MALPTGGTSTTTVLNAIKVGGASASTANLAAFNALCKDWLSIEGTKFPPTATLTPQGLFIPDRGLISLRAGDVVMVDPTSGVVILVPDAGITGGSFVTTAT